MEISFSQAREKNLGHFSSRISRDRDSCQCLSQDANILHKILEPAFAIYNYAFFSRRELKPSCCCAAS